MGNALIRHGSRLTEKQRPATRAELAEVKAQYKNLVFLSSHFYEDRSLQLELRGIYLGARHMITLADNTTKVLGEGQDILTYNNPLLSLEVCHLAFKLAPL